MLREIPISNTDFIPGYEVVEVIDVARGSTVRARHMGRDILAGLKNMIGGEISDYTQLMAEAREQAIARMITDAKDIGADAVINVRFMTAQVMQMASEISTWPSSLQSPRRKCTIGISAEPGVPPMAVVVQLCPSLPYRTGFCFSIAAPES